MKLLAIIQTVFIIAYHVFNVLAQIAWGLQGIVGAIIDTPEEKE